MNKSHWDQKGWFGICPIYIKGIETDAPELAARHWSLEWLMDISEALIGMANMVLQAVNKDFEPRYPIRVTGDLK